MTLTKLSQKALTGVRKSYSERKRKKNFSGDVVGMARAIRSKK